MSSAGLTDPVQIKGTLLARNSVLNFIGQAVPLLVGVATIPYVICGLGAERFGILALAWVLVASFSVFNLGLGQATTKFVAELLGTGERYKLLQSLLSCGALLDRIAYTRLAKKPWVGYCACSLLGICVVPSSGTFRTMSPNSLAVGSSLG